MADDYTPTQTGTEGMDFHLTDEDRRVDPEEGRGPQPGTEGMDFHLSDEDRKTADANMEGDIKALMDNHTAAELDEIAESRNVSTSGTKADVARRLVQSGYTLSDGSSSGAYSQEVPTKTAETTGPAGAPAT